MMAGKEQKVVLPPELWKEILQKLWQSEEDLKDVLTCRKVCRSWKELVDKMSPNLQWTPWFSYSEYGNIKDDMLQFHPATSFTCDSDVTNFLLEIPAPSSYDAEINPFRNQTVRLFRCRFGLHQTDVKNEEESLLTILREHGHHIQTLLWEPHSELPEKLMSLPLLLSSLTNLRTLIIRSSGLPYENKKIIHGEDFPKELKHLRELLFKCAIYDGSDVAFYQTLCGKLAVNYGKQIKSITISSGLELNISMENVLDCYPNLEDLKVASLDVYWWNLRQPSGNPWPKLRRLALSWGNDVGTVRFRDALKLVRCFSETLELLSLEYERSEEKIDWPNENKEPAVFPKLEKLILPLSTMFNEGRRQPIIMPIERHLNFGFPALKSVVLEDTNNKFGHRGALRNAVPIYICETLWPFVPSSVETISIRKTWRLDFRVGRVLGQIYKRSGNPTE